MLAEPTCTQLPQTNDSAMFPSSTFCWKLCDVSHPPQRKENFCPLLWKAQQPPRITARACSSWCLSEEAASLAVCPNGNSATGHTYRRVATPLLLRNSPGVSRAQGNCELYVTHSNISIFPRGYYVLCSRIERYDIGEASCSR